MCGWVSWGMGRRMGSGEWGFVSDIPGLGGCACKRYFWERGVLSKSSYRHDRSTKFSKLNVATKGQTNIRIQVDSIYLISLQLRCEANARGISWKAKPYAIPTPPEAQIHYYGLT